MTHDERELLSLWRELPETARASLRDYAAFLHTREVSAPPPAPSEPIDIPRPADEGVIAAIRRLHKTYPMLEHDHSLLNDASAQMTRHLIHGYPAPATIDELERVFRTRYEAMKDDTP